MGNMALIEVYQESPMKEPSNNFLVKVGNVPRKSGELIGLFINVSIGQLTSGVAEIFEPSKCVYLALDQESVVLRLVGKSKKSNQAYIAKAQLYEGLQQGENEWKSWEEVQHYFNEHSRTCA